MKKPQESFVSMIPQHLKYWLIHIRNIKVWPTEMLKVKNGIAPSLMEEVFKIVNPICNLRNKREFKSVLKQFPLNRVLSISWYKNMGLASKLCEIFKFIR